MAEFKKMFPSFGEHITIQQPPLQVDGDSGTMKLVQKIVVDMKENIENKITESIIEAARGQGITDLIVLDKDAIVDALQKQVPIEAYYPAPGVFCCPRCWNDELIARDKHCKNCGQALEW